MNDDDAASDALTRRRLLLGAAGTGALLAGGGSLDRLLATASASAARGPSLTEAATAYASGLVTSGRAVATSLAVIDRANDASYVGGYGDLAAGGSNAASATTLFEIGSNSKVFVATLLGLALDGRRPLVRLDTTLGDLIGDRLDPHAPARDITLHGLATYTSGLPDYAPGQIAQRQRYTLAELFGFLNAWKPGGPNRPGTYLYSNVGFGLLGYVLGVAQGTTWQQLVYEQICVPLAMGDTVPIGDAKKQARTATGYHGATAEPPLLTPVFLGGAGELRSTAHDMRRFLAVQLDPDSAPSAALARAIRRTQAIHFVRKGKFAIGLGWFLGVGPGNTVGITKNGVSTGFNSVIAFEPSLRRGLYVCASQRTIDTAPVGMRLIGMRNAEPPHPS